VISFTGAQKFATTRGSAEHNHQTHIEEERARVWLRREKEQFFKLFCGAKKVLRVYLVKAVCVIVGKFRCYF
jgi:hypothetical protein